ncbi:hypothetical protein BH11ACT3_BH11ACT3_20260 [soil metagenome]
MRVNGFAPDGLVDAVLAYEAALMADDVEALDALFAPGDETLRGDAAGLLVGHDAIAAFRRGRGGAPKRRLLRLEVRAIDDDNALVVAVVEPLTGGRGQQTQLWRRDHGGLGWVVRAAHVSAPTSAIQRAVWRVVGDPLIAPTGSGTLDGETVAVKDLYNLAGWKVGVGNPTFLAEATPASTTAPAVAALLAAGASVRGIVQTDEFAYSIAGANAHYGTPPNPAVPGGLPGGSSSGPASAVAQGQATIGLGTDTAGSIRVPASYNGLWGLRTTHGAVPLDGVWPLAPSFDTVGWLTRDARTLRRAAEESLPAGVTMPAIFVVSSRLLAVASDDARDAFQQKVDDLSAYGNEIADLDLGDPDQLVETFRVVQAAEAWRSDGDWVTTHPGATGPGVRERFEIASQITAEQEGAARDAMASHRARLDELLGDRVLLIPSAAGAAPSATADAATLDLVRAATLRLGSVANLTGRPALSVPILTVPGPFGGDAPLGLCLVGPRGSDLVLIEIAESLIAQ